MPISGLMFTLAAEAPARDAALRALRAERCLELGLQDGARVAAVLDTPSEDANKQIWRDINALPGVMHVDVVFVALDESDSTSPAAPGPTRQFA